MPLPVPSLLTAPKLHHRDVAATTRTCYMTETCTVVSAGGPTRAPVACPASGIVPLDCPALNGTIQTVSLGQNSWDFRITCGLDYNGVTDIVAVISHSFKDCLQACASYNLNHKADQCIALHFAADLDNSVPINFGNCWLKTSTGTPNQGRANTDAAARLVSSSWGK